MTHEGITRAQRLASEPHGFVRFKTAQDHLDEAASLLNRNEIPALLREVETYLGERDPRLGRFADRVEAYYARAGR